MRWNSDKKIICSQCGEKPASVKSNSLCVRCNLRTWGRIRNLEGREIKISGPTAEKYQHKAEIVFGQTHPTFLYHPALFYLDNRRYSPDFYDSIHNQFYEVIGSRQRFEQLKDKIKRFRQIFPNIKLILVCGDGRPYYSTKEPEVVGHSTNMELFA